MNFVQELLERGARFAKRNPSRPFSQDHPTLAEVNLSSDEAQELRGLLYKRQTEDLALRVCSCRHGRIVKKKIATNGFRALRYSCICDGPIELSEWIPIGCDDTEECHCEICDPIIDPEPIEENDSRLD